uniref:Uncharacterized protein n=1 Tax=Rhabditophanes sp. KR3021 TaxID=114890 RepID=A0AC35U2M4_9BILA
MICFAKNICIFNLICYSVNATFSQHFRDYILENYNQSYLQKFERKDLGLGFLGSLGGKLYEQEFSQLTPIILFNAEGQRALWFETAREYFISRGYKFGDIYGISIGDGGFNFLPFISAECRHIKTIREFISLVSEYRNSTLDIVAYSMSSPLVRKAILGGTCIDDGFNLGVPITNQINTFISVAGANYGFESCNFLKLFVRQCNIVNGLVCNSLFIQDINNQTSKFEGNKTHSIYSQLDWVIGQICCNNICSELKNADRNYILNPQDHFSIIYNSLDLMYHLFNYD